MKTLFKKITVSLLCGLAFIAPTVLASYINFPDVKTSDWFYSDVMNMVAWDVIRGHEDGKFKPEDNVNRAELSAMWNRYNTYLQGQFMTKDNDLYCDLFNSVFAEREYVYPILRDLGYNPDDYGQDVKNPITTNIKYVQNCN